MGGVSVELVHLGSLYHDDVMDEALTRRTVDSVNARWGNLKAILGGDFLLAKASEIAASLGPEVAGLLAATIGRLCEGQVRELRNMFDVNRSEEAYLAAIRGKTAALFATACRIGAIVAGHPRWAIDRLTTFGEHYGVAFQIVDDILDVVATDEQLGKPSGNDLVQGVYTLPVIRTLSSAHGEQLRRVLGRPLDATEMEEARSVVRANGAVGASIATAREYLEGALEALAPFGDTPGRPALCRRWATTCWPRSRRSPPDRHRRPRRPARRPPCGDDRRSALLAGGAEGGGPPVPDPADQHRVAAPAGQARPAVAVEVVLVVARVAVDAPVVAQRRPPALERRGEDLAQRAVEPLRLGPGHRAGARGRPRPATAPRPRRCCRRPATGRWLSSCVFTRARLARTRRPQRRGA